MSLSQRIECPAIVGHEHRALGRSSLMPELRVQLMLNFKRERQVNRLGRDSMVTPRSDDDCGATALVRICAGSGDWRRDKPIAKRPAQRQEAGRSYVSRTRQLLPCPPSGLAGPPVDGALRLWLRIPSPCSLGCERCC
jgi:hypothetical protein